MFGIRIFGKTDLNLFDLILLFPLLWFLFFGWVGLEYALGSEGGGLDFLLSLGCFGIAYAIYYGRKQQVLKQMRVEAGNREAALDYDAAIVIWEELGEIDEAGRLRKLRAEMTSTTVSKTVIHGDQVHGNQITSTEIKDSVLSRSNVGGGSSRMQELEKLTEMKDKGAIDDDEFQQMKNEILGK